MNVIKITNNILTYNHQVIKISNISSLNIKERKVSNSYFLICFAIGLAILGFNITSLGFFFNIFLLSTSIFCFWLNFYLKKREHCFILIVQTNSGIQQLYTNKDFDFINRIKNKIEDVLNNNSVPVNVTYNLDNKTIINNPTGNINITNVSKYEGLSQENLKFLIDQFEPAIQKVNNEVINSNNEEIRRNFEMLKDELKTSKPRKSILEATWAVVGNLASISDISTIIEKGVSLF